MRKCHKCLNLRKVAKTFYLYRIASVIALTFSKHELFFVHSSRPRNFSVI